MGTSSSKRYLEELEIGVDVENHEGIVLPELLLAELNRGLKEDDYIAKSMIALKSNPIPLDNLQLFDSEFALRLDDLSDLLQPGYLPMENGYARRGDGVWCIAILTDLGHNINGEMFDWWFCHCEEDEHHKW